MQDDAELNYAELDKLRQFYRIPTGVGSQGGYDRLFSNVLNIPDYLDNDYDREVYKSHWQKIDRLAEQERDYIRGEMGIIIGSC